ncbi:hypothetical protein DFP73DRAFT_635377, partial [Morchella snyderi]
MSLNNEDSELTKHSKYHELDDDDHDHEEEGEEREEREEEQHGLTAVLPLSLGERNVSLTSTDSPTIILGANGTSPRFSRTPTRSKRPRQTLKTFEDLREYNQNRSRPQPRVDPPEQPRTLFRDLDAEGHVVYSTPSSPNEHISKNSWSSILMPGGHESHKEFNSDIFKRGSPRQENSYEDINRQTSPESESMNEPDDPQVDESSPFRHLQRSLVNTNSADCHQILSTNNNAQDLSFPNCSANQDVNAESQYEWDDWKCMRQETMRPTEYPELVARDTADNKLSESHNNSSGIPPRKTHGNQPPGRQERQLQVDQTPVRGFNTTKTNPQLLAEARIETRNPLNDTCQPPASTPGPISTSSFSSYFHYLMDFSKPSTAPPLSEDFSQVRSITRSSSIPNNISGTLLANIRSPYSSESGPGEEKNPVPRGLVDNDQAQGPKELEIYQKPIAPEKTVLNSFSKNPSVSFENDNSTGKVPVIPRNSASPGNILELPLMWAGSREYTNKPQVRDATQGASTPASFGSRSRGGASSIPNPPSSPTSTSRLSSPDLSIEHDNLNKSKIMAGAGKRSLRGWRMRWMGIGGKISSGTAWSTLRGKGGPKSSSDPEPTTKVAPAKRTKRLVKKASHMRRNSSANPAIADHVDGEALVSNASKDNARGEPESLAAESLGDDARRSTGDTAPESKASAGGISNLHPPQPAEPDTTEVVSSTPLSGRISGFYNETLMTLGKILSVGIEPTFGKLKRKVVMAKYTMGLGGRSRRGAPDGGENSEGVKMTPVANLPEDSQSIASIEFPPTNPYNPRNSDEVETRQLVDPVKETIAARG